MMKKKWNLYLERGRNPNSKHYGKLISIIPSIFHKNPQSFIVGIFDFHIQIFQDLGNKIKIFII
jgi:hypothetical protein